MNNDYLDLVSAVRLSSYELFCEAVKKINNINAQTQSGQSNILHFIIYNFKKEKLRVQDFKKLIELGVDINLKNKEGHTPLHYLVMSSFNLELAQILLNHNAIIDSEDRDGNTPLWRAVMNYRGEDELLQIILLIISKGADIDKKNNYSISARDIIVRRDESILEGGAKKEWALSNHLKEYL